MPTGPESKNWDKNWLMSEDGGAVAGEDGLLLHKQNKTKPRPSCPGRGPESSVQCGKPQGKGQKCPWADRTLGTFLQL